jgi:hypothetical protein
MGHQDIDIDPDIIPRLHGVPSSMAGQYLLGQSLSCHEEEAPKNALDNSPLVYDGHHANDRISGN